MNKADYNIFDLGNVALLSGEKLENSTKLNWKITWGKIRTSKEDEED